MRLEFSRGFTQRIYSFAAEITGLDNVRRYGVEVKFAVFAEFVHDDLARRDHDFRDLRAARGFDNDVLTGFETHPGGVEIENLPGVSKAYASNARQLVRHVPPVLPRGL